MASRTTSGTRILKRENDKSVRHTGNKLVVGRSSDDSVAAREDNTAFRPSEGA